MEKQVLDKEIGRQELWGNNDSNYIVFDGCELADINTRPYYWDGPNHSYTLIGYDSLTLYYREGDRYVIHFYDYRCMPNDPDREFRHWSRGQRQFYTCDDFEQAMKIIKAHIKYADDNPLTLEDSRAVVAMEKEKK